MADEITVTVTDSNDITVTDSGTVNKDAWARETFTGKTGTNNLLLLGNTFRANALIVFLNGILMAKTTDYTEGTNRDRLTVLTALETADIVEVRYVIN